MNKEFNLSEKIFGFSGISECFAKNGNWIAKSDVKEFIKKENEFDFYRLLCNKLGKAFVWRLNADEICEQLEDLIKEERTKLAGSDLIEGENENE